MTALGTFYEIIILSMGEDWQEKNSPNPATAGFTFLCLHCKECRYPVCPFGK